MKNIIAKRSLVQAFAVVIMAVAVSVMFSACIDSTQNVGQSELYETEGSPYIKWVSYEGVTVIQVRMKNVSDSPIVARFSATDSDGITVYSDFEYIQPGETKVLVGRSKKQYGTNAKFDFRYIVERKQ